MSNSPPLFVLLTLAIVSHCATFLPLEDQVGYLSDKQMSFAKGQDFCTHAGGHLPVLDTPEHAKYLAHLFRLEKPIWLGAKMKENWTEENDRFEWMDGSPINRTLLQMIKMKKCDPPCGLIFGGERIYPSNPLWPNKILCILDTSEHPKLKRIVQMSENYTFDPFFRNLPLAQLIMDKNDRVYQIICYAGCAMVTLLALIPTIALFIITLVKRNVSTCQMHCDDHNTIRNKAKLADEITLETLAPSAPPEKEVTDLDE